MPGAAGIQYAVTFVKNRAVAVYWINRVTHMMTRSRWLAPHHFPTYLSLPPLQIPQRII